MLSGWLASGQIAVVDRQVLEPRIGGLDEDLRLVPGAAQHALNAEHLVSDRIAVAERRQNLMNRGHAPSVRSCRAAGPRAAAAARTAAPVGILGASCAWRPSTLLGTTLSFVVPRRWVATTLRLSPGRRVEGSTDVALPISPSGLPWPEPGRGPRPEPCRGRCPEPCADGGRWRDPDIGRRSWRCGRRSCEYGRGAGASGRGSGASDAACGGGA